MKKTLVAAALALALGGPLGAVKVEILRIQTAAGFLAGTLDGVSVDPLGVLELAPRFHRVASIEEPFLLSAARLPDGWVVGTGNSGRVLRIDESGKVTQLFAAAEPEIFAVWADPDGTVWAGSSPNGKIYRFAKGRAEVWFDPHETYIWALARGADGALLAGTGTQGRLYRVTGKDQGTVLYDSDDTHVRSLAVRADGEVLFGTASEGLVLAIDRQGRARTLLDATGSEVVSVTCAPDGTCYAAVVASEAGLVDETQAPGAAAAQPAPSPSPSPAAAPGKEGEASATITVTASESPAAAAIRPAAARGPRSEVFRISPAGVAESIWTFQDETVYSLLWLGDRLWVGTGLEGRLFSFNGQRMVLEKDADERQIMALLPGQAGPVFATTNAAALYRADAGTEATGTYTSPALDAGQAARFGVFRWRGELPAGAHVRFSLRSGMSAQPDRTWSAWTAPREGDEIPLADLPLGRYVQWRAELQAGAAGGPRISNVEISHRHQNLRPRITRFAALDPGQVLVSQSFNPANIVFEPAHPTHDGIFTTLEPAAEGDDTTRLKQVWKKGYRTLRWEATDPNGDRLQYGLEFRRDASAEAWLPMAKELTDDYYSFDEMSLPDGVYRFRLVATDRLDNEADEALQAEQVSEPVWVDSTPPRLLQVDREGKRLRIVVEDALSPLRAAEVSFDGGKWQPAGVADGLLDSRRETLLVEPPAGARLILLRVMDAAFNQVSYDVTREKAR